MLWFALGMGFAVISVAFQGREHESRLIRLVRDHPLVPWSAAVALYLLLVAWLPPTPFLIEHSKVILTHVAFAAIAALLLLPAVFGDRGGGLPRRVLANPIVAWLGLISYGIFLWHYAAAQQLGREAGEGFVVVLLGTLVISIACAAISYYFVERPFLRLKYRRLSDVLRVGRAPPERHSGS
jgi:peptidoglycan/LPS O-acetylase OafA/YrhL